MSTCYTQTITVLKKWDQEETGRKESGLFFFAFADVRCMVNVQSDFEAGDVPCDCENSC